MASSTAPEEPGGSVATATAPDLGFDDHGKSPLQRVQHVLHANPTLGPLAVLVLSILAFSLVADRFLSAANLGLVLQQVTVIAVLALGQTLIILTAGIDLSVGAIAVFSSVLMANFATKLGMPGLLALLLGFVLGAGMGAINGVLVTRLKLPPFIVTLGTLSIFFSLNAVVSRSETIRGSDMPDIMTWTGNTFPIGDFRITYGSILMILIAAVVWYILTRTAFGRHVYATGDDPDAARLAGINTNRTLLAVYTLAGLICAVGGWVLIGRIGGVSPQAGLTANLDSITAVVIGGTSLFGGRGSIVGTLVGALIVGVFRNGLALAGLDNLWQEFAVGWLIIVAVTLDQWIRRVST